MQTCFVVVNPINTVGTLPGRLYIVTPQNRDKNHDSASKEEDTIEREATIESEKLFRISDDGAPIIN